MPAPPEGSEPAMERTLGIICVAALEAAANLVKDPNATWLTATLNQPTTPATLFLSVNPTTPGQYTTNLQVIPPNASTSVTVPVTYNVDRGAWFTRYGFVHLASYVSNVVRSEEHT